MLNRLTLALVAIIAILGGALVYTQFFDNQEADTAESGDNPVPTPNESGLRQVDSTLSDSITVNNPDWGYVQILPGSYNGKTVTYEAIPKDGCSFVAWLDHNGEYIHTSDRIASTELDPKGTTAQFVNTPSGNEVTRSYGWKMPTFQNDTNGNMVYNNLTYTFSMNEEDYEAYHSDTSVHRKAALGNVYLTPWELIVGDPAVKSAVEYLSQFTDGLTNMQKAWVVMSFVQDVISYQTDSAQYGQSEYWAYPIETMYSGKGDCEDTAILFCAIGSELGLDTGLVSFSYSDTERRSLGHMGAAVKLMGSESVSADNNPCFTYPGENGRTYCYVETACDSRFDLGYLLKYPDVDAYRIYDGGFTHILYNEDTGFDHEVLVAIGTSYDTSAPVEYSVNPDEVVYGDDFTNPPTIYMSVGDRFSYIPETNLPCTFSASGDGVQTSGGPFTMDPTTYELHGEVTQAGTYQVVIKAETAADMPYQVAYQYLLFVVSESSAPEYGGMVKSLSFTNGSWAVVSQDIPSDADSDEGGIPLWMLVAAGVCGIVAVVFVGGRIL